MRFKAIFIKVHWILSSLFGIDPLRFFRSLTGFPRYLKDLRSFKEKYHGCIEYKPCLSDWSQEAGFTKNEYFWQDLLVARMIQTANPVRHVDIGSRMDGFVAHVASFREIELIDVRPSTANIPGVIFKQADLMKPVTWGKSYCDSLSCLHALEHFGLGRYGDAIDPAGYDRAFGNIADLLAPGGTFYLSVPVGQERVEFNANRVFDARTILRLATRESLVLKSMMLISPDGKIETILPDDQMLESLVRMNYSLGVFIFIKH